MVLLMRRLIGPVLLLMGLPLGMAQQTAVPTFVIERPTIIAFFPPMTDAELDKNPDMNEVLGDFQLYASQASPGLKKAGVDFKVATALRFRVNNGGVVTTFKTGKIKVGYYFVAPGKPAHVEYGVMTDIDMLARAKKYFDMPVTAP